MVQFNWLIFDSFVWRALDNQFFKTFFYICHFIAKRSSRIIKKIYKMPHEILNRLLEYSHKNIAMEVENHYIERKERYSYYRTLSQRPWPKPNGPFEVPMTCRSYILYIRLICCILYTALPKNWVWKIENPIIEAQGN